MIRNSYWVIPGSFLVGPYPGSTENERLRTKIEILAGHGVRRILNLCVEDELSTQGVPLESYAEHLPETIRETRFSLIDGEAPGRTQMSAVLDYIDECLWSGTTVYMHCRGGKRRTGTVVACFLIRHALAVGEAAIEMNARLRSFHGAIPCQLTPAQIQFVRDWGKDG